MYYLLIKRDFSFQGITIISDYFFFFRNVNKNLISNISENCFDTLTNLEDLKMSHNRLSSLPIGLLKKLVNLQLL